MEKKERQSKSEVRESQGNGVKRCLNRSNGWKTQERVKEIYNCNAERKKEKRTKNERIRRRVETENKMKERKAERSLI